MAMTRCVFSEADGVYRSCRPRLELPSDEQMGIIQFLQQDTAGVDHKVALIDSDSKISLTYGQLKERAAAVAAALLPGGVLPIAPGSVVLVLCPNSINFMEVFLGVIAAGGIVTTVNPLNTAQEIHKQAKDSHPVIVFTVDDLLPKVEELKLPIVLMDEHRSKSAYDRQLIPYSTLHDRGGPRNDLLAVAAPVKQGDTAALLYSSGTTGVSKGVMLSHRNFIAVARILDVEAELEGRIRGEDVLLCMLPMFHIFGLAAATLASLQRGDTVVIMAKFDFIQMLRAIDEFGVTMLPTVPPVAIGLAKHPDVARHSLSTVRNIISGAAPLGKDTMLAIMRRLPGVDVRQGYGLTESSGVGLVTAKNEDEINMGSAGSLAAGVEAKVVDFDTGKCLPPNQQGELWMKGPHIMKGYFGNPSATAATIDKDGWLHTGDLVYFNNEGCVFVVDRIKELIKYKGFQVAPAELEALLLSHPLIMDAAVVPLPDDEAGQVPIAYVVRKPGCSLQEPDVLKFVAEQVAPYKKLRQVFFVDVIPKSAAGKILRRELTRRRPASKL